MPLHTKDKLERIILTQVILVRTLDAFVLLTFPVFWYTKLHIFKPLISECHVVNLVVVLLISASIFESVQWASITTSVALMYTCSINFWLKLIL